MIPYPFKTMNKRRKYERDYKNFDLSSLSTPDTLTKHEIKHLLKPDFSFKRGSWEIDLVYNLMVRSDIHLVCINLNTRYLVVYKLPSKSKLSVLQALNNLRYNYQVNSLKGDGEGAFVVLVILLLIRVHILYTIRLLI
jgi:IS30 family transposase